MNSCCATPNGLDAMFNESIARGEAETYFKKGIDKRTRLVVDAVAAQGIAGASVLEVGSGVGGLHLELLKAGAARATSVDLSPAYLDAAKRIAARLGYEGVIDHRLLDFARQADEVDVADVVVMNRVVCCYPHMRALVTSAADRTRQILALTFPRDTWWMRFGGVLLNTWMRLARSAFRFYLHSPAEIIATVKEAGLTTVFQKRSGPWNIAVFRREPA